MKNVDFSMVIDEGLFKALLKTETLLSTCIPEEFKSCRAASSKKCRAARVMVFILEKLSPFIENFHFTSEAEPGYEHLNWTRKLHLFMGFRLYRQLKMIHHDNNSYSMAVLIRIFVRFFLCCLSFVGVGSLCKMLDKTAESWKEHKSKVKYFSKKSSIKINRELSTLSELPGLFINCYDEMFFPELTILIT